MDKKQHLMLASLYIRTGTNEIGNSSQIAQLSSIASLKGWNYEIFSDVINGRESQPIKKELMLRLRRKEFDVVMIYRFSDWANSPSESLEEIQMLIAKGIIFTSYFENFDSSTQTGILYLKVLSAFVGFDQSVIPEPLEKLSSRIIPANDIGNKLTYFVSETDKRFKRIPTRINDNKLEFDLVDMNGAVLLTGYSKNALYSMTCRREIPFIKRPGGRKIFFSKTALQEWIMHGRDIRKNSRWSFS